MDPSSVSSAALHLLAGKYFQIAAFVMLAYDHMLTFGREVELIWMRPMSFATVLFLLNRYATLMQFIIIVVAFNDPGWKGESYVSLHKWIDGVQLRQFFRCTRYVVFEGTCTVALIAVGQMIMILRVVAIYRRSKKVFAFLLFLWTGQIIISAVGLRTGFAVPLPPGLVGCILTGSDTLFPSVWIAPLVTDSFIFLLTIYYTKHNIAQLLTLITSGGVSVADRAIMILLRDGVMYYFLIFLANLMNTLIYFLAEPDIKAIGASFSQLLTCTVISRLVLNLRSLSRDNQGHKTGGNTTPFNCQRYPPDRLDNPVPKQLETIWTRTLNDFTEDNNSLILETGHAEFDEVPLQQVEMTDHGNDDKDHPHHEV